MIKIHATKKLLSKLPVNEMGCLPVDKNTVHFQSELSENPLNEWHANLIVLQRRNCILMVHDKTRFALFMPCLTKLDFANLDWLFQDTFMNTLSKLGANQHQLNSASACLNQLCFDTLCDRSVQGTMNQMKGDVESMLSYDNVGVADVSSYRTGVWLSDRPCTVKGIKECVWPQKAMLSLLDDLSTVDYKGNEPSQNVINLCDFSRRQ